MPGQFAPGRLAMSITIAAALTLNASVVKAGDPSEIFLQKMISHAIALETRILESGRPLTDSERLLARQAGVRHIDRVRILVLDAVPSPEDGDLRRYLSKLGILRLISMAKGTAKGYGIIVTPSGAHDRSVIAHELVHVGQYERLGGIAALMRDHLPDLVANGYRRSELEDEAYRRAAAIAGQG